MLFVYIVKLPIMILMIHSLIMTGICVNPVNTGVISLVTNMLNSNLLLCSLVIITLFYYATNYVTRIYDILLFETVMVSWNLPFLKPPSCPAYGPR